MNPFFLRVLAALLYSTALAACVSPTCYIGSVVLGRGMMIAKHGCSTPKPKRKESLQQLKAGWKHIKESREREKERGQRLCERAFEEDLSWLPSKETYTVEIEKQKVSNGQSLRERKEKKNPS